MSYALQVAKAELMTATRKGTGIEEARKNYETVRVIDWINQNTDRIAKADLEQVREAFDIAFGVSV